MLLDRIREYCLEKEGVSEDFPFDEETLVFKVGGKMFALINIYPPHSLNLKCDPDKAVELREQYESITPGYHMNKKHWNTILLNGSVPTNLFLKMIDHSYELVFCSLKQSIRKKIAKKGTIRKNRP